MFLMMFFTTAIILIVLAPAILIQERKGNNRMIVVTFSGPDGSIRTVPVKMGFSWTIAIFKAWALLGRGQFIEFLIVFFVGGILSSLAMLSLFGFDSAAFEAAANAKMSLIEVLKVSGTWEIVGWVAFILFKTLLIGYYVIYGNKIRLRNLLRKGYSVEHPQNGDTSLIYEYAGTQKKEAAVGQAVKPGVVQGQAHQYVVPDEKLEEPEEDFDYSKLTMQDLKLLLKSEGIPFSTDQNKEQLLELVEEHIAKDQKAKAKKNNAKYQDSEYHLMTIQELVAELDKRGIEYKSSMKKNDLVKLLVDNDK